MNVMAKDDRQQPSRNSVLGKVAVALLFPLRGFLISCSKLQNCHSLDKILPSELHILSREGQAEASENKQAAIFHFREKTKQPSRLTSRPDYRICYLNLNTHLKSKILYV